MRFPVILTMALLAPLSQTAAQARTNPSPAQQAQREATRLDGAGDHAAARAIWQRLIDEAPDAAARAAGQRRMAMSYGFEGNCAETTRYETMVIEYWKTREAAEPQNAFYQEGEMANEAARVCIDAGDLDAAERLYRQGYELGNREPAPRTHPQSLWDFRMAHALARLAARRILDADTAMARQQERFYPYLVGYVALYTGDLAKAETALTGALAVQGNDRDPFFHYLLGLTYERMGQADKARPMYQKAYDLATGHNPPAAFTRPAARKKLAGG